MAFKISESYFGWDIKLFTEGFGKIFIQSKKLYTRKNPKPKNDVFSDFHLKITVFYIEKTVFGTLPKFSVKSR